MAQVILVPNGITDAAANVASGSEVDIDNGVGTPQDGALLTTVVDQFTAGTIVIALTDLPGDFDTVNSVQFRVRALYDNPGDDTDTATYDLTLTGTALPATSTVAWDQNDTYGAISNKGATILETVASSAANINAWTVVIDQSAYSKSMAADGLFLAVSEIEVLVDYNLAVVAPILTLPTEANITQTSATVGCTTDTAAGTLYWFVDDIATPPIASALKAGTGAIDYGNITTPGIGTETFNTVVVLTYNTPYYTYFIQNDGSDSNILESGIWTTLDATSDAETFGITLDTVQQLNKITSEIQSLDLILDEADLVNKITSSSQTFDLTLDQLQFYSKLVTEALTLALTLDQVEVNQAEKIESFLAALILDQQQSNIKTSEGLITFITNLNYQILKQLATNLSITLNTTLDHQFLGSSTAIITAAITFLANVNQIQTNVITADKAATLILEMAEQYNTQLDKSEVLTLAIAAADTYISNRDILKSISFDTQMNQTQINTLNTILLMSFNAALDKSITTQGSTFGAIINFATVLSYTFNTEGAVTGSILYGIDLDQQQQSNKLTDISMGFSVDADIITEINLVVERQIGFSTLLDETTAKQLLGQSGVTFGHIHGLAALNGAVTGESISFGTIQDFEVNGVVASFTVLTSDDRVLKVYLTDRTSLLDEELRVIRVNKT